MNNFPILAVAKREIVRIGQRRAFAIITFILPLILFFIIGFVYINQVVLDLPVAVIDQDGSVMSRLLVRSINSTRSLNVEYRLTSIEEVRQAFRQGKIQGAFVIPRNFTSQLLKGTPVTLTIYKNSSNLVISNLLYKEALTIVQSFNGAIVAKKLKTRGMSESQAMDIVNPLRIETSSLFNPGYNYLNFLVPGLLPMYLQMVITVLAALIFNQEFSEGSFKDLHRVAKGNIVYMLAGKGVVHVGFQLINSLIILGLVFPFFGLEIKSSFGALLLFFLLFLLVSFLIGALISLLFKESAMATQMVLIFNTPTFILSGLTFPAWAMPGIFRVLSDIFPYTSFMLGYLKMCRQPLSLSEIPHEVITMLIYLVLLFPVVLLLLRIKTQKWLRETPVSS